MNVQKYRTREDSLDDDLNLFAIDEWKFIDVQTDYSDIEYLTDIRDTRFDRGIEDDDFKRFVLIALSAFGLIIMAMLAIQITGVLDKSEIDRLNGMSSQMEDNISQTQHIQGDSVSNDELMLISQTLAGYFSQLQSNNDLDRLNDYCIEGSSYAQLYETRLSQIQTSLDMYDCSARMLRQMGSYSRSGKINDAVLSDGAYYIYINIALPTNADVSDFVYTNQYNMSKHFNSSEPTTESIMQYILTLLQDNPISCSTQEYCIKMQESNGQILISDDSIISSTCEDAYKEVITQTVQTVGGDIRNMP